MTAKGKTSAITTLLPSTSPPPPFPPPHSPPGSLYHPVLSSLLSLPSSTLSSLLYLYPAANWLSPLHHSPLSFPPSFLSLPARFTPFPCLFFLDTVQPLSALRLPVCSLISSSFSVPSLDPAGNDNVAVCCHYFTDQSAEIERGPAENITVVPIASFTFAGVWSSLLVFVKVPVCVYTPACIHKLSECVL